MNRYEATGAAHAGAAMLGAVIVGVTAPSSGVVNGAEPFTLTSVILRRRCLALPQKFWRR